MKKLMLIINPQAGRGGYRYHFEEALQALDKGGCRTTLFYTAGRGDATRFAAEHGAEYDCVACIGGDGTLSEVISGLMQLDGPPPLGYIPMGTANDVATTLGLPKNDTLAAVRRFLRGEPHPFDVGGFGDDGYFAYIAAFGAFTEVSYATPQNQKKALGHLAYVLQGAAQLPYIESYRTRVEYDDGVIEADLVYGSMSNSTSVAGIVHLKEEMVSLGDGVSELVLVKDPGSMEGFGDIVTSVLSQRFDSEKLLILHTRKARFTFEKPVAWTRDGEAGGEHQTLELCNYEAPIRLIF
ncbi:MAG: diacylglycerol kinase family lipid kinase [Oscillospiraceae bacterium]|nr:diacylglycerol kinase family lipid kinase [Oscillospiraceae bacterium]